MISEVTRVGYAPKGTHHARAWATCPGSMHDATQSLPQAQTIQPKNIQFYAPATAVALHMTCCTYSPCCSIIIGHRCDDVAALIDLEHREFMARLRGKVDIGLQQRHAVVVLEQAMEDLQLVDVGHLAATWAPPKVKLELQLREAHCIARQRREVGERPELGALHIDLEVVEPIVSERLHTMPRFKTFNPTD